MLKRIAFTFLIVIGCFLVYHYKSLFYGVQQGLGQASILYNAKEIEDLLEDPDFPDSIKVKFKYIAAVKSFSEKKLGLDRTENYTTFYDQQGKPILWVVTASPEFMIEAYEWDFPIAGSFPYKGFFELEKAEKEEQKMKRLGFDTEIGEVNAWSTLGWFKDPILSSMLEDEPGRLAELIIHESTHATLYVKDSVEFNENLASFIGRKGAELFLISHYGDTSREYMEYVDLNYRKEVYKNYIRNKIDELNKLYSGFSTEITLDEKRRQKQEYIQSIKDGIFKLDYRMDSVELKVRLDTLTFNNAYFSGFNTYSDDLPELEILFNKTYRKSIRLMIKNLKKKYD